MRNALRAFALALVIAAPFAATTSHADACDLSSEYRQMNGSVAEIDAAKLMLAQRSGDRVLFQKSAGVAVMGARSAWSAIQAGDRAIVAWSISDNPAIAHQVCILEGS